MSMEHFKALGGESLLRNNRAELTNQSTTPGPLNLKRLICVIDNDCQYHTFAGMDTEEKARAHAAKFFAPHVVKEAVWE